MKALTAFLPWLEPHLPGAPQPMILQALRDTCIEFCERTNAVQTVEVQSVTAGQMEYDVSGPSQHRLGTVLAVALGDGPALSPVAVDAVLRGGALRAGVDSVVPPPTAEHPTSYFQRLPTDATIFLWPAPAVDMPQALAIRASFVPTRTATQVDDVLFDVYLDDIVAGTLSRLMRMSDQPFTDMKGAEKNDAAFAAGRSSAAADSRTGASRGSLRVRGRSFT